MSYQYNKIIECQKKEDLDNIKAWLLDRCRHYAYPRPDKTQLLNMIGFCLISLETVDYVDFNSLGNFVEYFT